MYAVCYSPLNTNINNHNLPSEGKIHARNLDYHEMAHLPGKGLMNIAHFNFYKTHGKHWSKERITVFNNNCLIFKIMWYL